MLILQRGPDGRATFTFTANVSTKIDCLEVRFESEYKGIKQPSKWELLEAKGIAANTVLNGTFTLAAPGWHVVTLRGWTDGKPGPEISLPKVGVGEVFITAGQSNSANHGAVAQRTSSPYVFMWSGSAWMQAADPIPGADGVNGSPWIPMADALAAKLQMPIAISATGVGGTAISQWTPGTPNFSKITDLLTKFRSSGVRAVLWHQGEADARMTTQTAAYLSALNSMILKTRESAPNLWWFVAKATVCASAAVPRIASAQQSAVNNSFVFAGPDTDQLVGNNRMQDLCHFSDLGLKAHGQAWATALLQQIR